MAANAAAAQGPSHLLQGIDFVAQPDDRVLLTLSLSDVAPEPRVFTVDQPARISIDLPDTALALSQTRHVVGVGDVTTVDAVEADRSEEHTSELQSLMRISYAVFCLKKKKTKRVRSYHLTQQQ